MTPQEFFGEKVFTDNWHIVNSENEMVATVGSYRATVKLGDNFASSFQELAKFIADAINEKLEREIKIGLNLATGRYNQIEWIIETPFIKNENPLGLNIDPYLNAK